MGAVYEILLRRSALLFTWVAAMTLSVAHAEETTAEHVTVSGDEEGEHDQFTEMGEYAQPAWAERSRFSSSTSVYVLSPYEMFAGNVWQADFPRGGKPRHLTQEIDFGLPHRFEVGMENEIGLAGSDAHESAVTLEARYALANWNAIPLNPAISAEYIFGVGKSVRTAASDGDLRRQPDAFALRLLLGQNFGEHLGYGFNIGMEQYVSRDSGREFEISQSIAYGAMRGQFEFGAEMSYTHSTRQQSPIDRDELLIGPTIGWKPTRQLRISIAPLLGCTHDSPRVANFLLVSYEFGGAESIVEPISAR